MKRFLIMLLCMLMIVPVCMAETAELPVVAVSNYPLYVVAEHIMGNDAEIVLMNDDDADLNAQYDLLVVFGTEEWIESVQEDTPRVAVMESLTLLDNQGSTWTEGADVDEHFWMAPINMAMAGYAVSDALCEIDISNTDSYVANAESFMLEMVELDGEIRKQLAGMSGAEVNGENGCSVSYFASEYGLVRSDHDHAVTLDVIEVENELDYNTRMLENAKRVK